MSNSSATVISADAVEHLDPLVGQVPQVNDVNWSSSESVMTRRPRHLPGGLPGYLQAIVTSVPLLVFDWLAITFCLTIASLSLRFFGLGLHPGMLSQGFGILLCYLAIGSVMGLFPGTATSPVLELRQLVRSILMACGLMLLCNKLFATLGSSEIIVGVAGGMMAAVLLPLVRAASRHQFGKYEWWGERAIIIGAGSQGQAIYRFYQNSPNRGLKPIGIVDFPQSPIEFSDDASQLGLYYLGSVQEVSRLAKRYHLRWGIVAPAGCDAMSMNQVMKFSRDITNLIVLPSQYLIPSLWSSSRECAGVLGVHVKDYLHSSMSQAVKRTIDLVVALLSLVLLSPLFLLLVVLVKLNSHGPAFFGHERVGHGGKKFKAWKLRTMVSNARQVLDQHLEECPEARMEWMEDQKLRNDPRIIPKIGHFLRKTSLDELPQLLNVLKGEMSLVGPRPIVMSEVSKYGEMYSLYLRVTPGITGLWQISGRNDTSYDHRVRLDSYYVCNWSVWMDAYICIRTIRTMLLREGAY